MKSVQTLLGVLGLYGVLLVLVCDVSCSDSSDCETCDISVAWFQKDLLTQIAEERGFLRREGIHRYCGTQIFGSIQGFDLLLNGSVDIFHTTFDTIYSRRVVSVPPIAVSAVTGIDLGANMVVLAHSNITSLSQLDTSVYAADAPSTGFIPIGYEAARLSGVDLSTVANVSGFSDDDRLRLVNGENVRGAVADWAVFVRLWSLPQYYSERFPNVHKIADISDFVWPIQAGTFCARATAQDDSTFRERLTRYQKALLRSYEFATKKSNRKRVIDIIQTQQGISKELAEGIYDTTIGGIEAQTGLTKNLILSKRGMFNIAALRYNQNVGPAPGTVDLSDGAGNLVDLRALSDAYDDLNLGSATECYESNLQDCK